MKLHPQVAAALAARPRPTQEQIAADPMAQLVATRDAMVAAVEVECGPPMPIAHVSDVDADGVLCRLYVPVPGAPVVLFLHGGGWVMGSLETHDGLCRRIADRSGCAVLSVDYRLAPECPYPAALDDAETALGWLRREAEGVDATRIAVCGDSAGGHLAAVLARRQRDAGTPLAYQVLIYPVIDPTMAAESYQQLSDYGLESTAMALFWAMFLGDAGDRESPDIAPLAADLAGLPPALILTAEYDVLRDEGERYGEALLAAGVPAVVARYLGVNHGWVRKLALFDAAGVAADQVAAGLRAALTA
ncbi:alpha/beta hydrolase [Phytohabitans sp. ZYX-F-186]|uniref:Alpha/beta hydrolase n=1 Tax=Phytohabitans maris TaxID=3071409 RepID=A0ABU0ZGK9_9ACTN|nr:alpha/beta hydrolase [Phytohabitans sp. ZYX-F-186]MDQ7905586.1 alpha/beta hydrolase [Phytohabitans sp. ZYX-F-186]